MGSAPASLADNPFLITLLLEMQTTIFLRTEMSRKTEYVHNPCFLSANILKILGVFAENQKNQFYYTFFIYEKELMKTIAYDNSKRIVNVRYYLYGSNGKIEKMYSKGSRGSREETYFYENDRLQKIVIRQFDRNDIEQDTLQHSFDYKSNGELKSIILSTELYSETIYQET